MTWISETRRSPASGCQGMSQRCCGTPGATRRPRWRARRCTSGKTSARKKPTNLAVRSGPPHSTPARADRRECPPDLGHNSRASPTPTPRGHRSVTRLAPIGGILAIVKANRRVDVSCDVNVDNDQVFIRGCLRPPLDAVPITIEITDQRGEREYLGRHRPDWLLRPRAAAGGPCTSHQGDLHDPGLRRAEQCRRRDGMRGPEHRGALERSLCGGARSTDSPRDGCAQTRPESHQSKAVRHR